MSAVEELLGRLERVKRSGEGWTARCPAHEDRSPSLSVGEGEDGRVLVKCHAGCETAAILAALGLEPRDLFPEKPAENGSRHLVARYPYVDEQGELLFEAVRFAPKGFKQRRPDGRGGWTWNLGGARRVLYRLPAVVAATGTVYVCEGEKDVQALEELGLVATTSPMGAGKWRDEYAESLRAAGRVVILPDDDEEGRAHADQVARSLADVVSDVRVVDLWGGGGTKRDVADWIALARTDEEQRQARSLLERTVEATPPCRPAPVEQDREHTWTAHDLVALSSTPPEPPTIGDLLYLGKRHVFSGESEAGKSMLLLALAAGELLTDHGVVWVDTDEMGAAPVLEVLRCFGVDDGRISRLFAYMQPEEAFSESARGHLTGLVRELRVRLIVFDAFNASLTLHGLDPSSTVEVERFLRQVVNPLCAAGAAVALPDHVVKKAEERGKYAYGSERKQTGVDVHVGMKAIEPLGRGRRGRSKLTVHKDRPGFLARPCPGLFVLNSDPESGRLSWRLEPDHSADDEGEFRPTRLMEKVSRHLEIVGEPQSRNAIEQAVPGKTDWKRAAIDRLIAEGFCEEVAGERGARLVKMIRVFREADEWDES